VFAGYAFKGFVDFLMFDTVKRLVFYTLNLCNLDF